VLDWFRQQVNNQGGGKLSDAGFNQALREYILGHEIPLEEMLRRVVREELAHTARRIVTLAGQLYYFRAGESTLFTAGISQIYLGIIMKKDEGDGK